MSITSQKYSKHALIFWLMGIKNFLYSRGNIKIGLEDSIDSREERKIYKDAFQLLNNVTKSTALFSLYYKNQKKVLEKQENLVSLLEDYDNILNQEMIEFDKITKKFKNETVSL